MSVTRQSNNRLPGLDGIRALSIILVLFAHLASEITQWSDYGVFGVQIFFVLSGFLITWLLCIEENQRSIISLPSFYARRALRILPPAFLYIAIVSFVGWIGYAEIARREALYCILFIRNLMPNGREVLGHFWSLAIEEQFYLLWPVSFFLLSSQRRRLYITAALFAAAPFWRHEMYQLAGGAFNTNSGRFDLRYDALMIGCCLGLLRNDRGLRWLATNRVSRSTPAALFALAMIVAGLAGLPGRAFSTSLSLIGVAGVINYSVEREDGMIGTFLNWAPVVWLGQISYSLYLWQQLFCLHSKIPWFGRFPQNLLTSLIVAAVSYYAIEVPLGSIRKRIPYFKNPRLFGVHSQLPVQPELSRLV